MKKIVSVAILLSCISFASAASCVDISKNLTKGNESSIVLTLQNFLVQKGLLKAIPNGYFGPATFASVKAYQKSIGLSQVGNTGPATRAAIKKETCDIPKSNIVMCTQEAKLCSDGSYVSRTGPNCAFAVCPLSTTPVSVSVVVPTHAPVITSIDKVTFISGATTSAPLVINGNNFATSTSNTVIFKLQGSNKVYTLGAFASTNGTTTIVSSIFTNSLVSCGLGCLEYLPVGGYDVIVKNSGGESNAGYTTIKSFTSSSSSGSQNLAIVQQITQAKLGTVTFSSSVSVSLENLAINITGAPFDTNKITNVYLRDELTGNIIGGASPFDLAHLSLYENQSKIYGIYADINSPVSGMISVRPTLSVKDYIGNNLIQVNIPSFLVTISG